MEGQIIKPYKINKVFVLVIFVIVIFISSIKFQYKIGFTENNQLMVNTLIEAKSTNEQEWLQTLVGSARGYVVTVDKYNNCYIVGSNNSDAFIVKYDVEGIQTWYRIWGGLGTAVGYGVAIDFKNNSLFCVGKTLNSSKGTYDAFLVKYDLDGTQSWNRTWRESQNAAGFNVAIDNLSNCYVAGVIDTHNDLSGEAFLTKFDTNGTQLWNRTLAGPTCAVASDLVVDSKNNCYLGCTFGNLTGNITIPGFTFTTDIFIAKYNPEGIQLWNRTWRNGDCQALAIDSNDNCYILQYWGVLIIKIDSDGNQLWSRSWQDTFAVGTDIAVDNNNNCYITGNVRVDNYFKTYFCAFVVKFSADGIDLLHRFFYDKGMYWGSGIIVDNYYNYYVVGYNDYFYVPGAFIFKGNTLFPNQISGFEWLFLLIIGEIGGLIIIEIHYRKRGTETGEIKVSGLPPTNLRLRMDNFTCFGRKNWLSIDREEI